LSLILYSTWIQYKGTRRQHFDLVESKRILAVKLGAKEVSRTWVHGELIE